MGMTCCGSTKDRTRSTQNKAHLAPQEQEISFPSYSSPNDKLFSSLETTYNYFKHITFADYTILLINFTIKTATLSDQQLILPIKKLTIKHSYQILRIFKFRSI